MNWLKNIGMGMAKKAALSALDKELPLLRERVKALVAQKGKDEVDAQLLATENRLLFAINTWGPHWAWLDPIRQAVGAELGQFAANAKEKVDAAIADQAPDAIDAAFAKLRDAAASQIQALSL